MKLKQNLFLKILVFLLALVFFAGAAAMAIYQIVNFNVLWGGEEPIYGFTARMLFEQDEYDIQELIRLSETESLDTWSQWRLEALQEELNAKNTNLRWQVHRDGVVYYGNADVFPDRVAFYARTVRLPDGAECELLAWLDPVLRVSDDYRIAVSKLLVWENHRVEAATATAACAVMGIVCIIYLCVTCGHKKGVEGIYLNWFHHIPGDLLLAAYIFGGALCLVGLVDSVDYYYPYQGWEFRWLLIFATACVTGLALLVISFLITLTARCKGRVLLRNTFIGWILRWLWKMCKNVWRVCCAAAAAFPLIWKVAFGGVVYGVYSFFILSTCRWVGPAWIVMWFLWTLLIIAYLCWWALKWKQVRQGAHEIIGGNTSCRIEGFAMPSDLREHADELNNLGQAIGAAVEERMRSEHFRAELITNVSHDLKTPLTSIISYVDLLKKEEIENPKVQEYIEVLDRKSQRLKKLTEDLVEASKASTGVLGVNAERLDLAQLAEQALGEYEERLSAHGLTVVRNLPPQPVWVMADGRHLWRILDNLLSNCVKYALNGTRVYVDVCGGPDGGRLSVKNISREELNIPVERLTERFVRGDDSRTLEGSGLGLSIAQSLAELQNGSFDITVDGDLFKVAVTLPPAPPTELL